ncbi:MAG: hypothetical protein IT360_21780 [Gemmatimonadaceae bacterium]|nr:hypothetical protein [Gemmatimonadaceae bacterium]
MKVKDLVILMFPGDKHDAEVNKGGEALYVKHVRKHLVGRGKDVPAMRSIQTVQENLVAERKRTMDSPEAALAQRAWLVLMRNDAGLAGDGPLEAGKQFEIIAGTDPFPAGGFDPDTGVYVINHAQGGVLSMFGIFYLNVLKLHPRGDAAEHQAAALVRVFQKLGINNCRKVAFASCGLADHAITEKSFLQHFVVGMHEAKYETMAAGWDLPFEIVTDAADEGYGRKRGTVNYAGKFLKDLRTRNKYVYVYQSAEIPFEVKADKVKHAASVDAERTKAVKTFKKGHTPIEPSWRQVSETPADAGRKVRYTLKVDFVDKLKYAKSGWSNAK